MKLRSRFASMCIATVMAIGAFGIEASASGTISVSNYNGNVVCSISGLNSGGNTSTTMFKVNSTGTHTVSYTVGSNNETYVRFVDSNGNEKIKFTIPKSAPGMPSTLSSSYSFDNSIKYRVKAYTPANGSYNGTITIAGASTTT